MAVVTQENSDIPRLQRIAGGKDFGSSIPADGTHRCVRNSDGGPHESQVHPDLLTARRLVPLSSSDDNSTTINADRKGNAEKFPTSFSSAGTSPRQEGGAGSASDSARRLRQEIPWLNLWGWLPALGVALMLGGCGDGKPAPKAEECADLRVIEYRSLENGGHLSSSTYTRALCVISERKLSP
jgi:hypothetical protein